MLGPEVLNGTGPATGHTSRRLSLPPRRAHACSVPRVHFVIMGCGRVGVTVAESLESFGHSVAIIDFNPDSFRRLPPEFEGQRVTGMGFDRDSLRQAGIEDAYGFAAVSNGDNSNILSARVVRETFGVERVRIFIHHFHEFVTKFLANFLNLAHVVFHLGICFFADGQTAHHGG